MKHFTTAALLITPALAAAECVLQPEPCLVLQCTFSTECVSGADCKDSTYAAELQTRSDFRDLEGSSDPHTDRQIFIGEWVDNRQTVSGMLLKNEAGTISLRADLESSTDVLHRPSPSILSIGEDGNALYTVHADDPLSATTYHGLCKERT